MKEVGNGLDWSLMSPGKLQTSEKKPHFKAFTETALVRVPTLLLKVRFLRVLAALLLLPQMRKFSSTYSAVADLMLQNLEPGGAFKGKVFRPRWFSGLCCSDGGLARHQGTQLWRAVRAI